MSDLTLHIPDDLAGRLAGRKHQIREILELGLRELSADPGFPRVNQLLEKSRAGSLTPAEESEWDRYEYIEHLVRLAKAAAQSKIRTSSGNA